jgi:hypothetical protein
MVRRRRLLSLTSNSDSTIDIKGVTGNVVCRRVQGQESRHTRNLFGFSKSLQGNTFTDLFQVLWIEFCRHVRGDKTRADAIDGNTTSRKLLGVGPGQGNDTTLGGRVP